MWHYNVSLLPSSGCSAELAPSGSITGWPTKLLTTCDQGYQLHDFSLRKRLFKLPQTFLTIFQNTHKIYDFFSNFIFSLWSYPLISTFSVTKRLIGIANAVIQSVLLSIHSFNNKFGIRIQCTAVSI